MLETKKLLPTGGMDRSGEFQKPYICSLVGTVDTNG